MVAAALLSIGGTLPPSARAANLTWDNDANSANNNLSTGAGLGGAGAWGSTDLKWFDGTNDIAWTDANKDIANFIGTGGAVTLGAGFTVGGLVFTGVTSGAFWYSARTALNRLASPSA